MHTLLENTLLEITFLENTLLENTLLENKLLENTLLKNTLYAQHGLCGYIVLLEGKSISAGFASHSSIHWLRLAHIYSESVTDQPTNLLLGVGSRDTRIL